MDLPHEHLEPLIGARIHAAKPALIAGTHAAELRALLEARGVLVFPQVHFTHAEQIAFTRTLGECLFDRDLDEPTTISLDPAAGSNTDWLKSSFFWHFDG